MNRLRRTLSLIRWDDTILLQGSPFLGALASLPACTAKTIGALIVLMAGSTLLVAHVFLLNDWIGVSADRRDPNRAATMDRAERGSPAGRGALCLTLLAASLLLLSALHLQSSLLAVAIAALSALYSGPVLHGKGIPVVSTILHLLGAALHFLLGYSLFAPIDARSVAIATFFSLAFAAGHLTQEARDRDVDLRNGITTNAVAFGKVPSFAAGLVLFGLADVTLVGLALGGAVPRVLALAAALYPLHLHWGLRAIRAGLDFESFRQLQIRYRGRYALTGLAMAIVFLLPGTDADRSPPRALGAEQAAALATSPS